MAKTYRKNKSEESERDYESPTHKRRRIVQQQVNDFLKSDVDAEEYFEEDDFEEFEPIKRKRR